MSQGLIEPSEMQPWWGYIGSRKAKKVHGAVKGSNDLGPECLAQHSNPANPNSIPAVSRVGELSRPTQHMQAAITPKKPTASEAYSGALFDRLVEDDEGYIFYNQNLI